MKIESPDPRPRDNGDYRVESTPCYGDPHAEIHLDEDGKLRLQYVTVEDCDRLIRAAALAKEELLRHHTEIAYVHGRRRIYQGRCQLCGKPEGDELHAEPAMEAAPEPGPYDEAIRQAEAFAQPGNTVADILAAQQPEPSGMQSPRPVVRIIDQTDGCECGHPAADHHDNQVTGGLTYCNACGIGTCGAFRPAETADAQAAGQ